jgi:hypothetical protein
MVETKRIEKLKYVIINFDCSSMTIFMFAISFANILNSERTYQPIDRSN